MKIVQIGTGGWGKNHTRILSQLGVLCAVCDVNAERSKEYGEKYSVKHYSNLDDLIKAISVEQVKLLNKDKKLSQIIDELGLYDTRTLMDTRTENIITNFMYYRSNATPIAPFDNKVWFDSVLILESKVNQRVL